MKIQEVIDEVNNTWGEEHEEKRKKMLRNNVFLMPGLLIILISLAYLSPLVIMGETFIFSSNRTFDLPYGIISAYFNIPYYLFDLRVGVIVSIASILLSLYVSVGKYADGAEGVYAEARRAAYRQFVKIVGFIIFVAFLISFWHGLLAGYLKGESFAPEWFFLPRECPDWGRLIVPADMDLSRYGEMPLWILVFFAWFTISSALMLTYSEKDILIHNVSKIRKYNQGVVHANRSVLKAYFLAEESFNYPEKDRFTKNLKGKFIGNSQRRNPILPSRYSYPGFRFKTSLSKFLWNTFIIKRVYGLLFILCISGFVSSILSFQYIRVDWNFYLIFIIFVWESIFLFIDVNYVYKGIYKSRMKYLSGQEKARERVDFYGSSGLNVWVLRIILIGPVVSVFGYLLWKAFTVDPQYHVWRNEVITIVLIDSVLIFFLYIFFFKIKRILQMSIEYEIRACMLQEFKESICNSGGEPSEEPNYLLIPYFYYLMLDVKKIYSDYKTEHGDKLFNEGSSSYLDN